MIGRVAGVILHRAPDHVLIDVRGVGYLVHVSERTAASLPPVGEAAALYTDLLVREALLQLFGFPSLLEKEWHRLLTSVQGVGAKASLAILGTLGATRALAGTKTPTAKVPSETAGPYPGDGSNGPNVLDDAGIVRHDIRRSFGSSRTLAPGVPLRVNLTVTQAAKEYAPLAGAAPGRDAPVASGL